MCFNQFISMINRVVILILKNELVFKLFTKYFNAISLQYLFFLILQIQFIKLIFMREVVGYII